MWCGILPPSVWAHVAIKSWSSSCWHLPQGAISFNSCIWLIVVWRRPTNHRRGSTMKHMRGRCLTPPDHCQIGLKILFFRNKPLQHLFKAQFSFCGNFTKTCLYCVPGWICVSHVKWWIMFVYFIACWSQKLLFMPTPTSREVPLGWLACDLPFSRPWSGKSNYSAHLCVPTLFVSSVSSETIQIGPALTPFRGSVCPKKNNN